MERLTLAVFCAVYAGMILGGLPRLKLDRTGVALLGAIVLISSGAVTLQRATAMVDLPTVTLLFGLMILSAQLRLGGFYTRVSALIAEADVSPPLFLGAVIGTVALLSAIFSNDIVCLAVPPVIIHAARARRLDPVPYLLATACAANAGSAATLIGNPQNMLIGQVLQLSFARYLAVAILPVLACLLVIWAIVAFQQRGRWGTLQSDAPEESPAEVSEEVPEFNRWQTTKGLLIAGILLVLFLATPIPREILALAAAGILLCSRRMHSHRIIGLIDWPLLVLFAGLFVANGALQQTRYPALAVSWLQSMGVELGSPFSLYWVSAILSNVVSNVPAVMLLLPFSSGHAAGSALALASTLAGNLTIVGSIANLIVVDIAARHGIAIDWKRHARTGVPVTLATLALVWAAL